MPKREAHKRCAHCTKPLHKKKVAYRSMDGKVCCTYDCAVAAYEG